MSDAASVVIQGVEKACREIVKKAGEEAEAAHKEAADWKERWEQALQKSNQLELKACPAHENGVFEIYRFEICTANACHKQFVLNISIWKS